jgi:hypothetical protein
MMIEEKPLTAPKAYRLPLLIDVDDTKCRHLLPLLKQF